MEEGQGGSVTRVFQPVGEADRRLVANVRPEGWTNPEPQARYDLVVVGAGTGGLVSAAIGAALGARVALVERALMGGDCLNFGCVPSKALLRAARSWAEARASAERFGGPVVGEDGDFPSVMERMRGLRADLSAVDGAERFRSLGVDVFLGEARFDGPESVVVGGVRLPFRRAILATGARAAVPPIPGLSEVPFLTNESVFDLTALPERLLVLGAGPVGCELAQAFARFGSRVTLLDMAESPLPREEPEASAVLRAALEGDGVSFFGGAKAVEVTPRGEATVVTIEKDERRDQLEGDALLVAVGRAPNVDLGLETAGVAFTPKGVAVDDRLRTTNRRIYAVGDVASSYQFTHVADAQARLAVRNALFFGRGKASALVVPAAIYTSPEVARVGPTLRELREEGVAVETLTVRFSEVDRARLDGDEEGFLQLHLREGKDEILGATLVGPHAGDLISQVTQAKKLGLGLAKVGEVIFPYPTTAEALRKAADLYRRRRLTPGARRLFDLIFRVTRRMP
jgi:pyruvate/2-oxoglutarate dehydrogenase complex dihydrolipoamide dehydrogenase (E3) component